MPLLETLPTGRDTAQWSVWSTTARLVVTDPRVLGGVRVLVERELAAIDAACSRFRPDSELSGLDRAAGRPVLVSPLLAELVAASLEAARVSGGDVDPTIGGAPSALGYDRDFAELPARGEPVRVKVRPAPGWQHVALDGRWLSIPDGVTLDLGATAKAFAADRCARLAAERYGVGILVSLGGDIATAGPALAGGWRILVRDRPCDPDCTVAIPAGGALATSSSVSRQWLRGTSLLHHILDPRTCAPAEPVWRTVSVAAYRCVDANTMTTAALVKGHAAPGWLREGGAPARLVSADSGVLTLGGWPPERQPIASTVDTPSTITAPHSATGPGGTSIRS